MKSENRRRFQSSGAHLEAQSSKSDDAQIFGRKLASLPPDMRKICLAVIDFLAKKGRTDWRGMLWSCLPSVLRLDQAEALRLSRGFKKAAGSMRSSPGLARPFRRAADWIVLSAFCSGDRFQIRELIKQIAPRASASN